MRRHVPAKAVKHRRCEPLRKGQRDSFQRPIEHAEQGLRVVIHAETQRRRDGALFRKPDPLHAVNPEIDNGAAPVVPGDQIIIFVVPAEAVRACYVRGAAVFIDLFLFGVVRKIGKPDAPSLGDRLLDRIDVVVDLFVFRARPPDGINLPAQFLRLILAAQPA